MLILDTNICIYLIKKRPVQVFEKFKNIQNQRIGISIITFAELMYGAEKSAYPQKNKDALNEFISPFEIHDYSIDCIHHYAMIRSQLEKGGITIGSWIC